MAELTVFPRLCAREEGVERKGREGRGRERNGWKRCSLGYGVGLCP